jgi:hypothetical protein
VSPEAWQAVAAIVGTLGAVTSAIAVALIGTTRAEAKRATTAAEAARDNTVPISNGFARSTTATLDELARRSRAHEARLTWLTDALGQHLTVHHHTGGRVPRWTPPDGDGSIMFGYGDLSPDDAERVSAPGWPGGRWGIGPS